MLIFNLIYSAICKCNFKSNFSQTLFYIELNAIFYFKFYSVNFLSKIKTEGCGFFSLVSSFRDIFIIENHRYYDT